MAIIVVSAFVQEDTVKVWAYIYNEAGSLVDPTGVTIDIYDPDGTIKVDGEAMTQSDTGIYYAYYHQGTGVAAMDKGKWRGKVTVSDGVGADTIYSSGHFTFEVK